MIDSKHFLQTKYWKEVKKQLGNEVFKVGNIFFQTTKLPFINKKVGYIPRADINDLDFPEIIKEAKKHNCVFVSVDPSNIKENSKQDFDYKSKGYKKGIPVQLQKNIIIELDKPEEEILSSMKNKHRYNIKVAQKKKVTVEISDSEEAFEVFLKLYKNTKDRHGYIGRSPDYVETVWNTLKLIQEHEKNSLVKIATVYYRNIPIVSWFFMFYGDTIYYPYGGSDYKFRNIMGPFALVWEMIKWGKENGYKKLDLMGIDEDITTGFSRFKIGFNQNITEYYDTFDIPIDKLWYRLFRLGLFLREKFNFIKNLM